jgi:LuxR family maltose regulon positive regulatory protein
VVLGEIRLALGGLHDAIRTVEQLVQYVMDQGEPISPHAADLHRELGELYLEQDQLEAAAQQYRISKELGEKAELPVWRYRWYIAQARLSVTRGDQDWALALLDEAERLYIRTSLPDSRPIPVLKARIWLFQGRLIEAQRWLREHSLTFDDDLGYLREFEHITLIRILLAWRERRHLLLDGFGIIMQEKACVVHQRRQGDISQNHAEDNAIQYSSLQCQCVHNRTSCNF